MSTSAVSSQNGASSVPANASSGKAPVQPTEVGWLFVPQYYTFLNNDPNKLHCFYTKKSTLVHGTESEETSLCFGQQQIHDKIVSLGFSDAKVYVSNVDSQASAAGGIIIQVLGEMSNAGGAWRKFAQTFFLAEQPNGYFVLNDIFRYLKEDGEVEEEAVDVDEAIQDELQAASAEGDVVRHQIELQPQAVPGDVAAVPKEAAPKAAVAAEPDKQASSDAETLTRLQDAQANGIVKPQEPTAAESGELGLNKKVTSAEANDVPATKGATEAVDASAVPSNAAAATPALNGTSNGKAAPAAPAVPKTWANLAASNATKWGSTVSAEAKGVSAARESAAPSASKPSNGSAAVSQQQHQAHRGQGGPGSVFIKNVVVEQMPSQGLQAALEAQFGPMKECQVIPSKACAFAEFATAEAARKAIQMSLPVAQGGEGGVKVGNSGWTVTVEEKRKPADRPQAGGSSARGGRGGGAGGAPVTRGGRGGARGGMATRGGRTA